MSRLEDVGFKPATLTAVATSGANAIGTVTIAAPGAGMRIYVTGWSVSYSAAVLTIHVPDIVSGSLVVDRFQAAAATILPLIREFARPVECPAATSVVVTVPAAGAAVVSTFVARYFIA